MTWACKVLNSTANLLATSVAIFGPMDSRIRGRIGWSIDHKWDCTGCDLKPASFSLARVLGPQLWPAIWQRLHRGSSWVYRHWKVNPVKRRGLLYSSPDDTDYICMYQHCHVDCLPLKSAKWLRYIYFLFLMNPLSLPASYDLKIARVVDQHNCSPVLFLLVIKIKTLKPRSW